MLSPILLLFIALAFFPEAGQAHKVNLFAYEEDGTVFTESYFGDGTPCRECEIAVLDENKEVFAEGLTDGDGLFQFPCGKDGNLLIRLRAGMGHGARITLSVKGDGETENSPEGGIDAGREGEKIVVGAPVTVQDVERIVELKIAPLRSSLKDLQITLAKPDLSRIIGGIGWIVGIAGAYLWGVSRKRN
jgi:nickel transport protein